MDTGAAFTGSAGDDTFNATVATLGALDVVDAGAGTDTLSVVETNSITTWGGASLTGFETAKVSTTGSIGTIKVTAGAPTAATAQVATVTVGRASASQKYDVTIGGVKYTTAAVSSADSASAATVITDVLNAHLADSVTVSSASSESGAGTTADPYIRTFTLTSKIAGTPLPSLSYAISSTTSTATGTVSSAATTANVVATAPVAIKETQAIVLTTNPSVGDTMTVSVDGADYTTTSTGATVDTLAADIAALLNAVLGAGSAVAATSGGRVTVTALTAGTPLPMLNIDSTVGSTTDALNPGVANKALAATAVASVALAAPTGVTSYTATATGVANVSGAATTDITASGTVVQTSVGNNVTVTSSDSVFVSGAKGAVTIGTAKSTTTISGAVAADTATGTAGDAAGVYVTGGTTVTITGTKDTGAVKIGAAPYAKAAVSTTGYPESNGNSSKTPTGDVSITNVTKTASTTTGESIGTYGTGTATVYTNGATTVTVKGAGTTVITDAATQTLKATAEATAVAGTSKLATVNLAGLGGNATIKSDAISTITVADTLADRTVTVSNSGTTGANAGAINLQVSNVGSSSTRLTLDNSTATSVNVSSGAASSYGTVGSTTSNSSSKSWVTLTTPKATSVTMTNSLAVDIGDTTAAGMAKVATIDASGASGAVTATVGNTPTQGLTFTGGTGADSVTLKANSTIAAAAQDGVTVKTSIVLGAGNDKLLNAGIAGTTSGSDGTATVSSGAVVDGGDGTDIVSASLINSGNAEQFKNFETIDVKGGASGGSLDSSLLTGSTITGVAVSGNINSAGAFTVSKISGTNIAVSVTDTGTTAGSLTATLATSTGTADTAAVTFNAVSAAATGVTSILSLFKTTGIETVAVASGGALSTATSKVTNSLVAFEDSSNTTASITITGTQDFKLGTFYTANTTYSATSGSETGYLTAIAQNSGALNAAATANVAGALKAIDGSAATGKLTIVAGADDQIESGTYYTTFSGLTITGGAGDDTIVNTAKGGVVNGGAGNDTLILAGGLTSAGVKASANGGDGNDTITVLGGVSTTLTGGAGKDTFDATEAFGSGVVTTITDYVLGTDTIKIAGSNSLEKATTTSGTYDALLAAADTQASSKAVWFQFDGNTYIVGDTSSNAADVVVKLVGLFNLTTATASTGLIGEA